MKQRITVEQLNELTLEQMYLLRECWEPKMYDVVYNVEDKQINCVITVGAVSKVYDNKEDYLPLLSIGHLIELATNKTHGNLEITSGKNIHGDEFMITGLITKNGRKVYPSIHNNICDALWYTVKTIISL